MFQLWPLEISQLTPGSFCHNHIIVFLCLWSTFLLPSTTCNRLIVSALALESAISRRAPVVVKTKIWAPNCSFFLRDIIIYLILHLVFLKRVSISVQKDQPYHIKPKSNFYLPSYHQMPQWTVSLYHTGQYLWARS